MKKTRIWILSVLIAVVLLLGSIPAMAEDDPEWKINEYSQLVSRKSAAEKLESIIVPAEVNGIPVRGVEYMAFNMHKNFKQMTIEDSAVMLDRRVLRDLLKLEAVDLPENLLIIREGNFTNLPKLTNVVIPASVSLIHSSFNKCESLTSITFEGMCPVFVTVGSFGMFTNLPADCVIYVPDNQVDAYKAAFADREDVLARIQPSGMNAERIDWTAPESDFVFDASTGTITGYTGSASCLMIPASIGGVQVKHLAESAFNTNYSLCYVVIPEGVESVGKYCFSGELLSYVSLPSTLTSVGGAIFGSRMSAISYNAADVPAYEAAAFDYIKSDAWQLILPYGASQEMVDSFAAYMAANAPAAVVKASIIEPYSFPALDAEAGAAFLGDWYGVAGKDVMGEFTDYYPQATVTMNPDSTGVAVVEGDEIAFGWYVDSGSACMAAVADGVLHEDNTFCYASIDENGRLVVDFGYASTICEQEGVTYAAPAVPEKPWPEFNADDARYYIGIWQTADGAMTLTLNDDGTATSVEMGEEAYALQWYAEYPSAFVGPAMSELAEINFDGAGNIIMEQDGASILMKPYVEATVIEGADELLGDWYDDIGNKLTLVNDGTMTHTYASDGWVDEYKWDVIDGAAVVTEGLWEGAAIYMEDGIVFIDNSEGIFQLFSADGNLSAYYGEEEEYELPEAQPIGAEGEPYFGTWTMDMGGMAMNLILSQDGTCTMEMMGEAEPGVWTMEDGRAYVMGDEISIDAAGQLVMPSADMTFVRSGDGAAVEETGAETSHAVEDDVQTGDPYVGVKFEMTGSIVQGITMTAAQLGCAGDYVIFNADGSATLVMSGIDVQTLGWKRGKVNVLGVEYEDGFTIDYYGTYYNFAVTENGLLLDYFGMLRTYERAEGAAAQPAAAAEDPYIGKKFLCTGSIVQGMKLSAAQLGCAGDYVIFNADGSAELVMSGIPVKTLGWKRGNVNVLGVEYEDGFTIDYYGTYYNFAVTEEGLLLDYFGMLRTYEME